MAVAINPGERHVYTVDSRRTDVAPYRVDLEEYNGNGWCACQDFEFRMQPLLERNAAPDDRLRCHHIMDARAFCVANAIPLPDEATTKDQAGDVANSLPAADQTPKSPWPDEAIKTAAERIKEQGQTPGGVSGVPGAVVGDAGKPMVPLAGMPDGGDRSASCTRAPGRVALRRSPLSAIMQIASLYGWE